MSDDDLENLTTDDVPDERVEAVKQGLAAQEAIRKLQEENKKLTAALKRGRADISPRDTVSESRTKRRAPIPGRELTLPSVTRRNGMFRQPRTSTMAVVRRWAVRSTRLPNF